MAVSLRGSRKSLVAAYQHEMVGAQGRVMVDTYANVAALVNSKDTKPLLVQFVPGAFATKRTTRRFSESILRAASEDGRAAKVVVARTPWRRRAYQPSESVQDVTQAVLDTAARHPGEQIHLVGHSWSWGSVVKAALRLRGKAPVASVLGYTPTGHPPVGPGRRGFNIAGALVEELLHPIRALPRLGSVAIAGALAASIPARFIHSPLPVGRRVAYAAHEDATADVAELVQTGVEMSAILAGKDKVQSPVVTHNRLVEAGLPEGTVGVVPNMTHLSAVTDYRYGGLVYEALAHHPVHTAGMVGAAALRPQVA